MSFFNFNFSNEPNRVLPQVIDALQRLRQDPEQLALERYQRYDEPPPPYSASGETTQPPTPTPGPAVVDEVDEVDEVYQEHLRREARSKSRPRVQFQSQARRERARLEHQIMERRFGRRQTLPWDDSLDLRANSENNVRSRWVEQGIWGAEWGPAWPENSQPSMRKFAGGDGPFFGAYDPSGSKFRPGVRWGHEQGNSPSPSPTPEPKRSPGPWIWDPVPAPPQKPSQPDIPPEGTRLRIPRPTVPDPEASRPLSQFIYQISKEREWIKDDIDHKTPGRAVDLDALAYSSVKENWIKDGVWRPQWGELPGPSWFHEEPEEADQEEPEETASTGSDGSRERLPAEDDGSPPLRNAPPLRSGDPNLFAPARRNAPSLRNGDPNLFAPAHIFKATNDGTDDDPTPPPTRTGAETSSVETRTGSRAGKTRARQTAVADDICGLEEAPKRRLRSSKSARAENKDKTSSSSAPRQEERPKRRRGGDTAESEQPLKRSRHDIVHEGPSPDKESDKTAEASNRPVRIPLAVGTRRVGELAALHGVSKTASKNEKPRRSARIAERERQQKAAVAAEERQQKATVAAETRQQLPRLQRTTTSKKSKTAKRRRSTSGDEHGAKTQKRGRGRK